MLRIGLVGLPQTGKTTLFHLLTRAREGARGAHGRLEAHVGISRVPDPRLDRLTELFVPRKRVPATIEFADVSSTARVKALELLDVAPFRNAHALLHVVRAFRNVEIPHASESINPARDAQAMEDELVLADLAVTERRLERLERDLKKQKNVEWEREVDLLSRCRTALADGIPMRALDYSGEDLKRLRGFQFLSAKPLLIVINLDEADVTKTTEATALAGLDTFVTNTATRAVAVCARIELEIAQLQEAEAKVFLTELGLRDSGLDRVIRSSYELLGYISFFTVGDDECRAWSIPRGTSAHSAASEIHTDIARGFIRAEVVDHRHLLARGSLAACREYGEVRLEGKEYVVQDGDVINFRHAA